MTALDIFIAVVPILFVIGIFSLSLAYFDYVGTNAILSTFSGLQHYSSVTTLVTNLQSLALFFPTLAALMIIILIASSFMLSFFIKAHPLAAVMGIVFLIFYTIVSFFVSNEAVTVARLQIFSTILPNANLLLILFINMPVILIIATLADIAIALTAATGRIGNG